MRSSRIWSVTLLLEKFKRNEEKNLLKITKKEAHLLNKEYDIPFEENGLSKTRSKHPSYYLCESKENLELLLQITTNAEAERLLKEIKDREKRRKRKYKK